MQSLKRLLMLPLAVGNVLGGRKTDNVHRTPSNSNSRNERCGSDTIRALRLNVDQRRVHAAVRDMRLRPDDVGAVSLRGTGLLYQHPFEHQLHGNRIHGTSVCEHVHRDWSRFLCGGVADREGLDLWDNHR